MFIKKIRKNTTRKKEDNTRGRTNHGTTNWTTDGARGLSKFYDKIHCETYHNKLWF